MTTTLLDHADVRLHVLEPFPTEFDAMAAEDGVPPEIAAALQESFQNGVVEGRRQVEAETLSLVQALRAGAEQLRAAKASLHESVVSDVVQLSLSIAQQVVMAELKTQPEAIGSIVQKLLDAAEGRKVTEVRLNPSDAACLQRLPVGAALQQAEIAVTPSEEIKPGGCVLETGFGRLDARLETRLEEISAVLLGARRDDLQDMEESQ